jgi:Ca2+-binding RTX toxin-like protein
VQGDTISATQGSWIGETTDFRYQFERCASDGTGCTPFGSASASSSYTLTSNDVGSTLRVLVTAIDTAGSSTAVESSNATPVVLGPGPTNLSLPVVNGTPQVGGFISGSAGSWTGSGNTFTFQWKRCATATSSCAFIAGAGSSFYSPTAADFGQYLRVQVQATNSSGTRAVSSAAVGPVTADKPSFHDSPPIFGINQVGQTLSVGYGTWTGTFPITYTVQWRRCDPQGTLSSCVAIAGATNTNYTLTNSDNGVTLRAYVTATNVAGSVISISNHTFPTLPEPPASGDGALAPLNETEPAVTGQALVGSALQASPGTWVGSEPIKFTYSWSRCDATGAHCKKIPKATKIDYAVSSKDAGYTLRIVVVAKNVVGAVSSKSDITDTVAMIKPPVRGRRIIGTKGADYLPGGGGNDYIDGRAGNDTILGGSGNDTLIGGTGNDVIDGGSGTDKIIAGAGSDTIRAADGFKDHIDCGAGDDRVYADRVDVLVHCEVVTYPTG